MSPKQNLLPGTLDLLILKILSGGPQHGYGIASNIKTSSREVLLVDEGSLYPALQRLRQRAKVGGYHFWGMLCGHTSGEANREILSVQRVAFVEPSRSSRSASRCATTARRVRVQMSCSA